MTDAANRKLDVKNSDPGDIARDDPLYELSQIIGFSRPAETSAPRQSVNEQIDLEQELLSELENYPGLRRGDPQPVVSSAQSSPQPVYSAPEQAGGTDFEAGFERDFGDVFAEPEPVTRNREPAFETTQDDMVFDSFEDAMEAELFQPEIEAAPAPKPVLVERPRFEPTPAPAPQYVPAPEPKAVSDKHPDSLEDELLSLLGTLGGRAGADWKPETSPAAQIAVDEQEIEEPQVPEASFAEDPPVHETAEQPQAPVFTPPPVTIPRSFEDYVARVRAREAGSEPAPMPEPEPAYEAEPAPEPRAAMETVSETPASAPRPFWFEDDEPETETAAAGDDAALLDAFESELSEGLSLSLDEMSKEQGGAARDATDDFSIEDELNLDSAYEDTRALQDEAALQEAALLEIESVADELASRARSMTPPVLETSDLPAEDIEPMPQLDLPPHPGDTGARAASRGVENEFDEALASEFGQYDDQPAYEADPRDNPYGKSATNYDLDSIEDDLARDMNYMAHDLQAKRDFDDFDANDDEFAAGAAASQPAERGRSGRGMMVAAVVGGIAILGAVGAFALMGGDGVDSGEPVLVRADSDPVKVVPSDAGGREVPNQNRAVYGEVDGNGNAAPTQETLVSTSEEPIDLGGVEPLPSGVMETAKAEDRLLPEVEPGQATAEGGDQALLPPRRVRTVVVKPDGTFLPTPSVQPASAQPEPRIIDTTQPATPEPRIAASEPTVAEPATGASEAVTESESRALQQLAEAREVETTTVTPATQDNQTTTPRAIAVPATIPARPEPPASEPTQAASRPAPAQTTASGGSGYVVQISSQPSADLAQKSATDLSRRFSEILGGRAISIQRADIAGKGTFHRVRVAASDKADAVQLCETLKRAGGSCFVAR